MKYLLIPFLFTPFFCFSQISLSTGILSTGTTSLETGLAFNLSAGMENENMSCGLKFTTSEIEGARFNRYQFYIGPRFRDLHLGFTIGHNPAKYDDLKYNSQSVGVRLAYYLEIRERFGAMIEVNPGFDGDRQKWFSALVGVFYNFRQESFN